MSVVRKTDMGTLSDFLLARIAEDEDWAKAASADPGYVDWSVPTTGVVLLAGGDEAYALDGLVHAPRNAAVHIARWDPARVLAECEAKRRIVEEFEDTGNMQPTHEEKTGLWLAMQHLAAVYADHPDYREEWKP